MPGFESAANIDKTAPGHVSRKSIVNGSRLKAEPFRPAVVKRNPTPLNTIRPISVLGHSTPRTENINIIRDGAQKYLTGKAPAPADYLQVGPSAHESINRHPVSENTAPDVYRRTIIPAPGLNPPVQRMPDNHIKENAVQALASTPVQRQPVPLNLEPAHMPVQRSIAIGSLETEVGPEITSGAPETAQGQSGPDIDVLANDVYRILRRRLLNERERAFGVS